MKYNILVLVFLLGLVACTKHNALTYDGLKSNVKSIYSSCLFATHDSTYIEDTRHTLRLFSKSYVEYSPTGNLTQLTTYDANGKIQSIIKYKTIDNWLVAQYEYDSTKQLISSWSYQFQDNKVIHKKTYTSNVPASVTDNCKEIYEFDGLKPTTIKYYKDEELLTTTTFTYQNNYLKEKKVVNDDCSVSCIETFEYTHDGQPLSYKLISENEETYSYVFEYNEEGFPIKYVCKYPHMSEWDKSFSFQYLSVDGQGNWTERVIYDYGKPYIIEKRSIRYYN